MLWSWGGGGGLFGAPPREFGLGPNWWWEGGVVSEEKLSWMLSEMARVGVGATFFYMRYSGDEPFAVVPAFGSDECVRVFVVGASAVGGWVPIFLSGRGRIR